MARTSVFKTFNNCLGMRQGRTTCGDERNLDSLGHICRGWRDNLAADARSPVRNTYAINTGHTSAGRFGRLCRRICAATVRTSSQTDRPTIGIGISDLNSRVYTPRTGKSNYFSRPFPVTPIMQAKIVARGAGESVAANAKALRVRPMDALQDASPSQTKS